MRMPKTPKLIPVDLSKCCHRPRAESSGQHWHPEINSRKTYLAKIGGDFYAGRFSLQWYGWNFDNWVVDAGLQLDKPGTNASEWQGLWEIKQ